MNFIYFSDRCTCGQGLKYEQYSEAFCNTACPGNTYNNVEYCGGNNYLSVYGTGTFLWFLF